MEYTIHDYLNDIEDYEEAIDPFNEILRDDYYQETHELYDID